MKYLIKVFGLALTAVLLFNACSHNAGVNQPMTHKDNIAKTQNGQQNQPVFTNQENKDTPTDEPKTDKPKEENKKQDTNEKTNGNQDQNNNHKVKQEADDILQKYLEQQKVEEQKKKAQAESLYKLGKSYMEAGNFESAEKELREALKYDPNHVEAKKDLNDVLMLIGKGPVTLPDQKIDEMLRGEIVARQQLITEMEGIYSRGVKFYEMLKYDEAEREFRRIIEMSKWRLAHIDIESIRQKAAVMLEKTQAAKRLREFEREKLEKELKTRELIRDEYLRKLEEKRRLETFFEKAKNDFKIARYKDCVEQCDKILYINPNLQPVKELKEIAWRLLHTKIAADNIKEYIEEWKRTFERVNIDSLIQAEIVEWTDRYTWLDVISQRKPRTIGTADDEPLPEDKAIIDKLRSTRVTLEGFRTLQDIIDYLRDSYGFNIVSDQDLSQINTGGFKVQNVPLDSVLDLLLGNLPTPLKYYVEGGVIIISTQENLRRRVRIELYTVDDLTYSIYDFPGQDLSLQPGRPYPDDPSTRSRQPTEQGPAFTVENIVEHIQKIIIPQGGWVDPHSIAPQGNLLVVTTDRETHKKITKLLAQLRSISNIMISLEARFLMVEQTFLEDIGIDITNFQASGGGDIQKNFTASLLNDFSADSRLQGFYNAFNNPGGGGLAGFGLTGGTTLNYSLVDDISVTAIIRAVKKREQGCRLNDARLTVANNQRANMMWTVQQTYVADRDMTVVGPDPIVDLINTGISLDIRPITSADRKYVTMELRPTVALLRGLTPFGTSYGLIREPTIDVQKIRTTVIVPDKGTVLTGGFIFNLENKYEANIPLWRDIPILGNLGSKKSDGLHKSQLIILVRPEIFILEEEEKKKWGN